MRIYAGNKITGIVQDSGNTRFVGFSLPRISVSQRDVRSGSDFWFYILYVLSTIILYATCITTIMFVVSKTNKKMKNSSKTHNPTKSFAKNHPEILIGIAIVMIIFILLEVSTELIMAITWTVHIKDPVIALMVFVAALIYFSPGIFSVCKIGYDCYHEYRKERPAVEENGSSPDSREKRAMYNILLLKCFVWITAYFAYILLYSFFPAFVLAFAYPTRVITVFAFVATFMVLSVVCLTTYIQNGAPCTSKHHGKNTVFKIAVWFILTLVQVYFFLFVFALLYSLVIGRASVVSSAPLAILSLLPSILLSIAAWIMRSTLLENNEHEDTTDVDTDGNKIIVIKRAEEGKSPSEDTVDMMSEKQEESAQTKNGGEQRAEDDKKETQYSNRTGSETKTLTSAEFAKRGKGGTGSGQGDIQQNRDLGERELNGKIKHSAEM